MFRLVSGNLGRWVWACTLRVYKVFQKNWSGSLAKRRLCLGPAGVINCTPLSICIVLLSEFVSQNAWLQHYDCKSKYICFRLDFMFTWSGFDVGGEAVMDIKRVNSINY